MKIALLNPPSLFAYGKINTGHHCSFPLGLGYLAAFVRQFGHQVAIYDPEASRTPLSEMWANMERFKPDLIGLTSVTSNFNVASRLATEAKSRMNCYVIMGGSHVSALPEISIAATEGLDAVIRGEGEISLQKMAEQFDNMKAIDFSRIPGAVFFQEGECQKVPRSKMIQDLDQLFYQDSFMNLMLFM